MLSHFLVINTLLYISVLANYPAYDITKKRIERKPKCGPNKVYDSCPPIYPPLRCNVKEVLTVCRVNPEPGSPSCEPGCRCADNYYLNASGDCITEEECYSGSRPSYCNNKTPGYSECINGGCSKWRCTDGGYVCLIKAPCEIGCVCEESYNRSPLGYCIPGEPCPAPGPSPIEKTPPKPYSIPQPVSTEKMMPPKYTADRLTYPPYMPSKSEYEDVKPDRSYKSYTESKSVLEETMF